MSDKLAVTKPEFAVGVIDLSKKPYTVCCPECHAWACAPCRDEKRALPRLTNNPPHEGAILGEPHESRVQNWEDHPEQRVKAYYPARVPSMKPQA